MSLPCAQSAMLRERMHRLVVRMERTYARLLRNIELHDESLATLTEAQQRLSRSCGRDADTEDAEQCVPLNLA